MEMILQKTLRFNLIFSVSILSIFQLISIIIFSIMNKFSLFSFIVLLVLSNTKPITIAIIGTNDIHGAALPVKLVRTDSGQKYNYGGLVYMARLIQILQQENRGRAIYLDAGDQFQGGIQSSSLISSGRIMNDFFTEIGLQGSAIGNHQFDFGPQFLFPFMQSKLGPNLAANIQNQNGRSKFMPKQQNNGIKIGVIGLTTLQTPSTTAAFVNNLFPPYKFIIYRDIVLAEAKKLRKAGADAVLIVSHIGNDCPIKLDYGIWTNKTLQIECPIDQVTHLIDALPPGTIDGIIQGHRHKIVHHFYKGIPYMGSINGGYYFNVMHLTFGDKKRGQKTRPIINTTIEGPIPVCQKIFQNIGRCNFLSSAQLQYAGPLVNWYFHNKPVYAHPKVNVIYEQEWIPKMLPFLVELAETEIVLQRVGNQQNNLGNLITNLMHTVASTADFIIMNPGGLRTSWLPGVIQYQHFYNMFPFSNYLQTFKITGKELKATLQIIQQGSFGFYESWGLQTMVKIERDSKGNQKRIYQWGKFYNQTQINDETQYTGATIDFLLTGGDDFKDVIGKVYTPRNVESLGLMRDILKQPLIDLKVIKPNTLIDPKKPRLILQVTPVKMENLRN